MLTEAQLLFYQEKGYLVLDACFQDDIAALIAANNQIIEYKNIKSIAEYEEPSKMNIRRIYLPSLYDKTFEEFIRNPKLLDIVESTIGNNICAVNNILNMKPPKVGSEIKWHQDFAYMPHTNTSLVITVLFLDQATQHNGAICVCPTSHKKGFISHRKQNTFVGYVDDRIITDIGEHQLLEISKGSLLLMHPFLLHYSARNKSNKPRKVFISMYRASDCFPIYVNESLRFIPPYTGLVRGEYSQNARCEDGHWELPIAQGNYNSIFELQSGNHLEKNNKSQPGYFKVEY